MKLMICLVMALMLMNSLQARLPFYKDPKQPAENRINDLLNPMTIEEKASQPIEWRFLYGACCKRSWPEGKDANGKGRKNRFLSQCDRCQKNKSHTRDNGEKKPPLYTHPVCIGRYSWI